MLLALAFGDDMLSSLDREICAIDMVHVHSACWTHRRAAGLHASKERPRRLPSLTSARTDAVAAGWTDTSSCPLLSIHCCNGSVAMRMIDELGHQAGASKKGAPFAVHEACADVPDCGSVQCAQRQGVPRPGAGAACLPVHKPARQVSGKGV